MRGTRTRQSTFTRTGFPTPRSSGPMTGACLTFRGTHPVAPRDALAAVAPLDDQGHTLERDAHPYHGSTECAHLHAHSFPSSHHPQPPDTGSATASPFSMQSACSRVSSRVDVSESARIHPGIEYIAPNDMDMGGAARARPSSSATTGAGKCSCGAASGHVALERKRARGARRAATERAPAHGAGRGPPLFDLEPAVFVDPV